MWPRAEEAREPPGAGTGGRGVSPEPPEHGAAGALILVFRSNRETTILCCFKPPLLWHLAAAAVGSKRAWQRRRRRAGEPRVAVGVPSDLVATRAHIRLSRNAA